MRHDRKRCMAHLLYLIIINDINPWSCKQCENEEDKNEICIKGRRNESL